MEQTETAMGPKTEPVKAAKRRKNGAEAQAVGAKPEISWVLDGAKEDFANWL